MGATGLGPVRAHGHWLGACLAVLRDGGSLRAGRCVLQARKRSIVPLPVQPGDLPAANALLAGEQAAMFAGPLLGGAVMNAVSPSAVLAVNAATFFIATADSPARQRSQPGRTAVVRPRPAVEHHLGLAHPRGGANVRHAGRRVRPDAGL